MTDTPQIDAVLPLLPLQRGMLFHAVAASAGGDDPYILQVSGRIDGELDPQQVQVAWQVLFERHPALRCAFIHQGQSEPRQALLRTLPFTITTLDWQQLDDAEQTRRLAAQKAEALATPFALHRPPLLRFTLIRRAPQAWEFILTHHHIVLDGWSQSLLVAELYELIDAAASSRAPLLKPPAPYADVVRAVRQRSREDDPQFWRQLFAGWQAPERPATRGQDVALDLPSAAVRPSVALGPELTRRLEETGRTRRLTPATLCQAGWALVLARHMGSRDIVYGVTVAGRADDAAAMNAIGMFVNTVPVRIRLDPWDTLSTFVVRLAQQLRELDQRSHCDLAQVQRWAGMDEGGALLHSLVAFENFPLSTLTSDGRLRLSGLASFERTSLPLALVIVPGADWHVALQVDTAQIGLNSAQAMLEDFVIALEALTQSWLTPLGQILDQLSAQRELSSAPAVMNAASRPPTANNLRDAWSDSVTAHGARIAVRSGDSVLTYAQLDHAADGVAVALQARGVAAGDRVAICTARDLPMLVAMLAVVKVGATYVPLDPLNPAERLGYILADAAPAALISDASAEQASRAALAAAGMSISHLLLLETVPSTAAQPTPCAPAANAAAYVIYTSGSSGRPKGVLVTHDNVLQLFAAAPVCVDAGPDDRWSLFHSFAFDFSVWEIWGAWLSGGQTVIVPHDVARDPAAFAALVARQRITVLSQTPSAFGLFAEAERQLAQPLDSLRWLVFGGEALTLAALGAWIARHGDAAPRLINMYGITETTVHVTWRRILAGDLTAGRGSVIGAALPHLQLSLMDADGRPVPDGAAGEIWVGGQGVSTGYLNQPALTAERFVPDAQAQRPGQRAYRSGDLARRGADGETEYLGRIDQQVKIRGYRIELGEIEQALLELPQIAMASVGTFHKEPLRDASLLGLCAWVVARQPVTAEQVRAALATRLPVYMLPDALMQVDQLPLTINGKADRRRLPEPAVQPTGTAMSAPRSERERILCEAMAQALGVTQVGIDDNYFALGGDSIRSLRLVAAAQAQDVAFPLRKLFELPTVRALAAWLDTAAATPVAVAVTRARQPFDGLEAAERATLPTGAVDAFELSRLQAGMLFHADFGENTGLYLDLVSNRLSLTPERDAFERAVAALERSHPTLRTSFHLSGSRPLQAVHAVGGLRVEWLDFSDCTPAQARSRIARQDEALRCRPYVLSEPGLLRLRVSILADGSCWLSIAIHHVILDGWSVALLSAELLTLYHAARDGASTPPLVADMVDMVDMAEMAEFVQREQALMHGSQARDFWRQRLAQLPASELPRWGEAASGVHPRVNLSLDSDAGQRLTALCAASGLPAKAWLLGVAAQVLGWSSGSPAFALGLVVNGRSPSPQGERALGLFLNTIPLGLAARGSWRTLATEAFQNDAAVYDWRMFPLSELVRLHGGRKPFEVNLNFVHFRPLAGVAQHFGVEVLESVSSESTELPLTINFGVDPNSGALTGQLVANDSFSTAQIEALASHLATAIGRLLEAPDALADCSTASDLAWSVHRHNPTAAARPFVPLPAQVLQRLRAQPVATVLVDADGVSWQASELLDRVESLATLLRRHGAVTQQPVAIYQGRTVDAIASQLAITALGGWYVPLDTTAPATRIAAILDDLGAPLMLADRALDDAIAQRCTPLQVVAAPDRAPVLDLEQYAAHIVPLSAAYAIYTSGSTGTPKGVLVTHQAWTNHMDWMTARFAFGPRDRILHRTRASFDASVWEIWAPLSSGAVLVLAEAEASVDPAALLRSIERERISVVQVVPSLLEALIGDPAEAALDRLRLLFAGGETLRKEAALGIMTGRRLQLVNLYGPTETTIDATFEVVDGGDALRRRSGSIPIGLPIDAVNAVVVDEELRPLPAGAIGELLLGGMALARCYLGQPAMTAERFVPDPHGPAGSRAFRTRDLVRRLADGRLEFVGRLDRQVKIGGNRIELGEIEAALAQLVGSRRCAVEAEIAVAGGARRLVAYVEQGAAEQAAPSPQAWRAALTQRLPGYMVPAVVRLVAEWPLMASGKTDRAALTGLAAVAATAAPSEPAAAKDEDMPLESLLGREVAALLGLAEVDRDDDFFSIGGDSISAMQLVSRLRPLGVQLSAKDIFQHRSVRRMAAIAGASALARQPATPATRHQHWPLLPIQHWFFGQRLKNPHWYHQTVALKPRLRHPLAQVESALRQLGQRHDALASRFGVDNVDGMATRGAADPLLLRIENVGDDAQLFDAASRLQSAAHTDTGPLWGAALASADGQTLDAVVVAAHHLVIDGVSWRILLDELATLLNGGELAPLDTTLADAAMALDEWIPAEAEQQHWTAVLEQVAGQPHVPAGAVGESVAAACALTAQQTTELLTNAVTRWKASVEELLLAALMHTLSAQATARHTVILVEGHGRDLLDGVDLTRTVGWFTTQRPLLLPDSVASLADAVREAKTRLRAIPAAGGAWLKISRSQPALPPSRCIVMNYLGRFDGTVGTGAPFEALDITLPPSSDPANRRTSLLDLVGLIEQQCLRLTIDADGAQIGAASAAQLAVQLQQALTALTSADAAQGRAAWLASDFPLTGDADIGALLASYPETLQILPCTPVQQGMVFGQQLHGNAGGSYIQQLDITLDAAPDTVRLARAFNALAARHDVLRSRFVQSADGRVLQLVQSQATVPFVQLDLRQHDAPLVDWQQHLEADRARGIALDSAPLVRVTLAQVGEQQWRLLWTHHHLIADGWSQPLLLGELVALYQETPLAAPAAVPASYWQWLASGDMALLEQQWRQRFDGFGEPTLVASARNGITPAAPAAPLKLALDSGASAALQQFCRRHGLTLPAVIQAAWGLMLGKMLYTDDVAFGMVVSGRPAEVGGSTNWVGMFINTVPLRVQAPAAAELLPWLAALNQQMASAADSAHLSLPHIQSWVNQGRPLFDTIVVFENYPVQAWSAQQTNALAVAAVDAHEVNEYPLSLYVEPGKHLTLALRYDAAKVEARFVQAIGAGMLETLRQWSGGAVRHLGDSAVLAPPERALARQLGVGPQLAARPASVIEAVRAQAERTPDALALDDAEGARHTYAELLSSARRLAAALARHGFDAGTGLRIAILAEHRAPLLVAMLAVQLRGACFIPLDPTFPAERLRMILEDSRPQLVLHDSANRAHAALAGLAVGGIEQWLAESGNTEDAALAAPQPDSLAYILFTSGSTGRPKGVQIPQRAFANALASFAITPGLRAGDMLGAATTVSFDIALLELLLPLTVGATVLMIDKQVARDGVRLAALLASRGVTVFQGTPSTWKLLCAADARLNLSAWCGGEQLPQALCDELLDRFGALWNLYGPTETTIWSAVQRQAAGQPVGAGRPLANTTIFLADRHDQLAPDGAIGEICIGGDGVMAGYIGRPDLSAAAFIPDLLREQGTPAYRTGDLGVWHADGGLVVLGRRDRQLKLDGFRIEPGDIEAALRALDGVADAAVALQTIAGTVTLVGYLVMPAAGPEALADIAAQLTGKLPRYMIPARLMLLPALPLTLNGKLDQRALPLPAAGPVLLPSRLPDGALETVVLQAWHAAFGRADIGVEDDFFAAGGHSFVATQIHARLARIFRGKVSLSSIFEANTVARLAAAIVAAEATPGDALSLAKAYLAVQAMDPETRAALRARR